MKLLQIFRHIAFEMQSLAGHRMGEPQTRGMQRLAAKPRQLGLRLWPEQGRFGLKTAAIERIAEQRAADMRQMDPDLMRPAGFQRAAQQARDGLPIAAHKSLAKLPMGDRLAALL